MSDATTPIGGPEHLPPRARVPACWRLLVLRSPDPRWRGKATDLHQSREIVLGRAPLDPAYAIADGLLSRQHLALRATPSHDAVELRDCGSKNGTFRAGARVAIGLLGHQAVLRFGDTVAMVVAADRSDESGAAVSVSAVGAARQLARQIDAAVGAQGAVAVVGEPGAGKDAVLQAIARRGHGSERVLKVHCAGQTAESLAVALFGSGPAQPGAWVAAQGGWIGLDDVADLVPTAQAVAIAAIDRAETARHDAALAAQAPRVALLSQTALPELVAAGRLRPDLAARATATVAVPALRDQLADFARLADALVPPDHADADAGWAHKLTAQALEAMLLHSWPGNLRELASVLGTLQAAHPQAVVPSAAVAAVLDPAGLAAANAAPAVDLARLVPDAALLRSLLLRHKGNVEKVAQHFGRHRKQIYRWLAKAGIGEADLDALRNSQ